MGSFDRNNSRGGRSFGRRDFAPRGFGPSRNDSSRGGGDRPKFSAICSNCGKECEVPFRPTNGKPVYCSDCFEKMRGGRDNSFATDRPRQQTPVYDPGKAQLDAINVKLERILKILEAKSTQPEVVEPVTATEEEVKTPKVKKVTKKVSSTKSK